MDRSEDDTLFAELRELRPTPRPEFAAELDARAAAGFPRGADTTASVFAPLLDWWRGMSPSRRLRPILAAAVVVVVVATAAVAISQSGGGSSLGEDATLGMATPNSSSSQSSSAVEGSSEAAGAEEAATAPRHTQAHNGGNGAGGGGAPGAVYAPAVPSSVSPEKSAKKSEEGESGSEEAAGSEEAEPTFKAEESSGAVAGPSEARKSRTAGGRDIERSSYIVLGTKPGEVPGAAAKVYEAVHTAGGYVFNSSVQSGTTGATGASFELSIPSAKVDSALAAISSIAEVRRRHDATNDITAPTVSAAEELADSNAAIDGLLKQLGEVETEAEQESVEARLREERRHHAAIRASLGNLHQRASMSEVSVRIVTENGAGVTPPSQDSDSDWGVGDALHSAGHILTIAAGVVLIGLAVLAPFALFALLFWIGNRFRVRRLRERTLG